MIQKNEELITFLISKFEKKIISEQIFETILKIENEKLLQHMINNYKNLFNQQ